jgi:hypothetical protein
MAPSALVQLSTSERLLGIVSHHHRMEQSNHTQLSTRTRVNRIYDRMCDVQCFQFPYRANSFNQRAFCLFLFTTTIGVIFMVSQLSARISSINYVKVCSLLNAFNMSNHPKSLSPALLAAAAELSNSKPGKMEMLHSTSKHDKQLTPRSDRGRLLTSGTFWVILSCNDDPVYAFSIPVVSLAWVTVAGARPLVLLTGPGYHPNNSHVPRYSWIKVFVATLNELKIEFIVLDSHSASPVTFSQVSRLFGMKLQVPLALRNLEANNSCSRSTQINANQRSQLHVSFPKISACSHFFSALQSFGLCFVW